MEIRFGTDGWRAIIAEEFTFRNLRRVVSGIDRALRAPGAAPGLVVVGYDTRFLSRRFAEAAAGTLLAAGWRVQLCPAASPTPAASCQVVASGAAGAVVITASHNAAPFNGVKIKDSSGASAAPSLTAAVEKEIPGEPGPVADLASARRAGTLVDTSFEGAHRERLERMVGLPEIRRAGLRVVADPMHGACGRLLEQMLSGGTTQVTTLHAEPDPLFGGVHPEPLERHLQALRTTVLSTRASAGVATDGDGDRIGAFDEKGQFVSPLRIAPLLAWSLIRKGRKGPLAKTFANTILLDRIAQRYGLPFTTFPVGFKYIASEMQAGRLLLGGEESGGIGIEGFIPERDGTLISLMLLQAMVDAGKPLSELVAELTREFGETFYARQDLSLPSAQGKRIVERLRTAPPAAMGGLRITGIDPLDGIKLLFGGDGWILLRASGTEPVLRVYAETPSAASLDAVMAEAVRLAETA